MGQRLGGILSHPGEEPAAEPALDALAVEVFGLGQEGDPATHDQGQVEAVHDRQVVAGQDRRSGARNVFQAFNFGPSEQSEQRAEKNVLE